jgi:hypothetical protein
MSCEWSHKIFTVNPPDFTSLALDIFRFQYRLNPVYKSFVDSLGIQPATIHNLSQIPFLPIRFFKTHRVQTGDFHPALIFESSGTTQTVNSRHFVKDATIYEKSFLTCFESLYGPVKDWCIIGLLPSYLERQHSSLVYMVKKMIALSQHPASGFYLNEYQKLAETLAANRHSKKLLIGVTFALLDFAALFPAALKNVVIMETGGMKGRRQEMIRQEVHDVLKKAFAQASIHSEYGMTELLSQAYSKGNGLFHCPPWMKVLVRDDEDPLDVRQAGTGAINVIDLANVYSCSFIATDDAGRVYNDGSFEVLGRMDNSDLRGCSLLVL